MQPEVMPAAAAPRIRVAPREWIRIPVLFLGLTIFLAIGTEVVARCIFTSMGRAGDCMVLNDPKTGARAIPNCVCYEKAAETSVIEYRFNGCGHRAGMECGPKAAGSYRIVMTGSSVAEALNVQQRESFAALLPGALQQSTGRKVELYNEAMGWGFSHSVTLRFNDVLAAKPDLILWILTPADVQRASLVLPEAGEGGRWPGKSQPERLWLHAKSIFEGGSGLSVLCDFYGQTKTALMFRELLFRSPTLYVEEALAGGDLETGYLRKPMSAFWNGQLKQLDSDASKMEAQARAAGIPFVAADVPSHVQADMVSMGEWPAGSDPYQLDERLRSIIESHNGTFVDVLTRFRKIYRVNRLFLAVDGHPNANGQALFSRLLAEALTSGAVPGLSSMQKAGANARGLQ